MDWTNQALKIFNTPKPDHFTNYQHCCECAEHDETLRSNSVEAIGLEQLGNPGWDPLCFCSVDGMFYYMPALIRLTLSTIDIPSERYLDQFLFHMLGDGPDNRLIVDANRDQRQFMADFLEYLIDQHDEAITAVEGREDEILKAHQIWSTIHAL
jgi:hypothetical protein